MSNVRGFDAGLEDVLASGFVVWFDNKDKTSKDANDLGLGQPGTHGVSDHGTRGTDDGDDNDDKDSKD